MQIERNRGEFAKTSLLITKSTEPCSKATKESQALNSKQPLLMESTDDGMQIDHSGADPLAALRSAT
jgi:hypothetical protein